MGSCRRSLALLGTLALTACGDGATEPEIEDPEVVEEEIAQQADVYSGSIGLVIDTREIFRKGYSAETAEIAFAGLAAFDTTVAINHLTNVAILVIENDSLTDAEESAFAAGVATTIVVRDTDQTELGRLEEELVVDDSNLPVTVSTALPLQAAPLALGTDTPYLLQREGSGDLVTRAAPGVVSTGGDFVAYGEAAYQAPADPAWQQFTFVDRGDGTYRVEHWAVADSLWCVHDSFQTTGGGNMRVLRLGLPSTASCGQGPAYMELEQDPDGWMRLRHSETGEYVARGPGGLTLEHRDGPGTIVPNTADDADRFRLISDDIEWTISDRGTAFSQPIIPPARLDFAYLATLTNCSPGTLTETVGRTISQTRTTTFATTESAQLFAGFQATSGLKVGASTKVPIPPNPFPLNVNAEVSVQFQLTTSLTVTRGNTFEESTSSVEEVSRVRELVIPPFTAVTVSDYVRTIENVLTPFTQVIRLRGAYISSGAELSGREIVTQLKFNFIEGVISRVASDYVEFTVRGEVRTDRFLQAESTIHEKPNACR